MPSVSSNRPFDIIVFSTQRTGSTLLSLDIRNHGSLGLTEEYLIPVVQNVINNSSSKTKQLLEKAVRSSMDPETGIRSINIMSDQLSVLNSKCKAAIRSLYGSSNILDKKLAPRVIVYLYRSNLIKQAISRIVAYHTKVYHRLSPSASTYTPGSSSELSDAYDLDIPCSSSFILEQANKIRQENIYLCKVLSASSTEIIMLSYEEYVNDISVLNRLASIFNVKASVHEDVIAKRSITKMPQNVNQRLYQNFISSGLDSGSKNFLVFDPNRHLKFRQAGSSGNYLAQLHGLASWLKR